MKKFQKFSNINGFDENFTEKKIELKKTVMANLRSHKNHPPVIPLVLVEPPLRILLQTEIFSWAAQRSRRTVPDE